MSKNKKIGNSKSCKVDFYGANQASRKIYKKQIYYYNHKLCYQVGGNKSIDN